MPSVSSVPHLPGIVEDIPSPPTTQAAPISLACSVTHPGSFVLSGNPSEQSCPTQAAPLAQNAWQGLPTPFSHRSQEAVVTRLRGWALLSRDSAWDQEQFQLDPLQLSVVLLPVAANATHISQNWDKPGKNSISVAHQVPGFSSPWAVPSRGSLR